MHVSTLVPSFATLNGRNLRWLWHTCWSVEEEPPVPTKRPPAVRPHPHTSAPRGPPPGHSVVPVIGRRFETHDRSSRLLEELVQFLVQKLSL
jgi:hypothetical protein